MSPEAIKAVILEAGQVLIGLVALIAIILFQANGQPVPEFLWLILGALLPLLGLKIGLPLQKAPQNGEQAKP